ncbi:MAG: hypothetical protein JXR61_00135 [Prolixibacteraceae bacterium]|nr:hypothetical protein [Prolixibacteraceae bacterium]
MNRIKRENTKSEMLVQVGCQRHPMFIARVSCSRNSTPAGVVPSFLRFFSINIQIPDKPGLARWI